MAVAPCRFFKRIAERIPVDQADDVADNTRGIYALLKKEKGEVYDVVYIGCSAATVAGIWARLHSHRKEKKDWTHFSVFEVHDNVGKEEILELEALFLHIYQKDSDANRLNLRRSHANFGKIREDNLREWKPWRRNSEKAQPGARANAAKRRGSP